MSTHIVLLKLLFGLFNAKLLHPYFLDVSGISSLGNAVAPGVVGFHWVSVFFLLLLVHVRFVGWTTSGEAEVGIVITESRGAQKVGDRLSGASTSSA